MKLKYVGGHEAVEVPLPDGRAKLVERGKTADFPDELAELMLEQEANWQKASAGTAPAKQSKAVADTGAPEETQ